MINLRFGSVDAYIDERLWWASDRQMQDRLDQFQAEAEVDAPYTPDPDWYFAHAAAETLGGKVTDTSRHQVPESVPGRVY